MQTQTTLSPNYDMLVILLQNHLCAWGIVPMPSDFKDTVFAEGQHSETPKLTQNPISVSCLWLNFFRGPGRNRLRQPSHLAYKQ